MSSLRRSSRTELKNVRIAYDLGRAFYEEATAVWETEPNNPHVSLPVDVRKMEAEYDDYYYRCSKAGQILLDYCIFDQPLPGDLEERADDLSFVELLEEIRALI